VTGENAGSKTGSLAETLAGNAGSGDLPDTETGWWRITAMGHIYGGGHHGEQVWYARWDHGDDEQTVLGPFYSRDAAIAAAEAR